jgi:aspartyl-tRNA(Asn)/glutamyl-tRNA(Gln) amidotransferase subunit A
MEGDSKMQPFELSASEAAKQIKGKDLSPVTLVQSLLDRIDSLEPALKAWVYLDREEVLSEARRKEQEVGSGNNLGLLHGVPIGLKDIYYTAGIPTTACSKVYADFVPEYDATTVSSLKRAGAIMLGKTVTTEFACMDPSPAINPWNPAHTPGGSSSGSAVSVASRMCPAAMGSQTVGSVLRPASYNGLVGFKPTFGRVSRYGVIPVSWTLDTMGWLTRTVEDAALLLQVMAGPDSADPVASRSEVPDYLKGLETPAAPRIGVLRRFYYEQADLETQQNVDQTLQQLSQAGAQVEELPMPDSIDSAIADQLLIMAVEGASFHQPMYEKQAQDYQPKLREMLARGLAIDAVSGEGGRAAHPVHTHCGAGRPFQHWEYHVSGPVDLLRLARHHHSVRPGAIRTAPWHSVSSVSLRRSQAAGGGPLVRRGHGLAFGPAGMTMVPQLGDRRSADPPNNYLKCHPERSEGSKIPGHMALTPSVMV